MGFCYFNNIAVAAEELIAGGIERVAIVDIDVHHGNGTQHHFESRQDVLFVSLHQHPFYPGTGRSIEDGVGEGAGTTLNLPLPAGTAGAAITSTQFETAVVPAFRAFAPRSSWSRQASTPGASDPLGGLARKPRIFGGSGHRLAGLAEELCGGPGPGGSRGRLRPGGAAGPGRAFLDGWGGG